MMAATTLAISQPLCRRGFAAGPGDVAVVGGAPGGDGGATATAPAATGWASEAGVSDTAILSAGACLKRTRSRVMLVGSTRPASSEVLVIHADRELARRIEALAADAQRTFAQTARRLFPDLGAEWIEIGSAVATVLEPDSPVNGTFGLGMSESLTEGDADRLAIFFLERGLRPAASVSPFADPSVVRVLTARGWSVGALENVLAREVQRADRFAEAPRGIRIRLAETPAERDLWATLVAQGFAAPDAPLPAELRVGRAAVEAPSGYFLLAYADGEPAGTGELHTDGGVGWLSADTTLPRFRRRGVQGALQQARLAIARDDGCDIAIAESMPGSASQRNMERLGFRVVYTRAELLAPVSPKERT